MAYAEAWAVPVHKHSHRPRARAGIEKILHWEQSMSVYIGNYYYEAGAKRWLCLRLAAIGVGSNSLLECMH